MSDLPLPPSKAGGRSVSISEERQFGVSTIYRSVSISEERQSGVSTIYRSVTISEERQFGVSTIYRSVTMRQFGVSTIYRSVSISEERQFGVSTIYRLEEHTHVSTGPKISRFNYCIQCLYPLYMAVKAHSKKYRLSSTYCIMLCVIIAEL